MLMFSSLEDSDGFQTNLLVYIYGDLKKVFSYGYPVYFFKIYIMYSTYEVPQTLILIKFITV